MEEACEYSQHPDDPHLTVYKQTATYKVSGLGIPVNRAIEKVTHDALYDIQCNEKNHYNE